MSEMQADYGFEVAEVSEGHRVTYWKAKYPLRAIPVWLFVGIIVGAGALFIVTLVLGGIATLLFGRLTQTISWLITVIGWLGWIFFLGLPLVGPIIANRKRSTSPDSFVIGSEAITVAGRTFPRRDISRFFVRDLTGEFSRSVSTSGGYVVVGTGIGGAAMAVGAAGAHALGQAGRAGGMYARRAYESANIKIRFTFGEKDFDLATGLNAARAEALFNKLLSLLEKRA
jgi:hypothetical protein